MLEDCRTHEHGLRSEPSRLLTEEVTAEIASQCCQCNQPASAPPLPGHTSEAMLTARALLSGDHCRSATEPVTSDS